MSRSAKTLLAVCASVALTACSSTNTSTFIDNTPQFTKDLQAFGSASLALATDPLSSATAMNNAAGTYTGRAQVSVLGSGDTLVFFGDANLTASIGGGTVSGRLTNFRGGSNTAYETLDGAITVSSLLVDSPPPSDFVSEVSGALTGPQTTIGLGFAGRIRGDFRNSPTDGLYATGAINGSTLNGVPMQTATILVYADKQ